ncbi:MAG: NINE protein [Leptolyngbyaceae cyanobacterium bins.59]|nr:NINE protein [Leptolyngbyaceae cyanobacterium bins.59]
MNQSQQGSFKTTDYPVTSVQTAQIPGLHKVETTYLLWATCFVGLSGLHRIYSGKTLTGLLWLWTFGLFGIGQFLDFFAIPGMVEERNLRYMARSGFIPGYASPAAQVEQVVQTKATLRDEWMVRLLKAAEARGGRLSVTQAVMDTGIGFTEAETILREMLKSGYVQIDNDPRTGTVVYEFCELA